MKKLIIPLSIICLCFGKTPRYGDEQIAVLINEYFKTTPSAPMLLGYRFYKEKGERVFQIEIEGKDANIRNELLFGFSAMSQFSNVSKTKFRQFVLIIHFENHVVPVVAKSDIACLRSFFIDQTIDELNWRKKCLNIKEL